MNTQREITAGVTTFFTMTYVVVVVPSILATEGTGVPYTGAMTATVLVTALLTMLMGAYAKVPYAVAPGLGIAAFFTYSLVLGDSVPWPIALGIVFWSGVVFIVISVTPLREQIALAIPRSLRIAAAAGIGIFLTFIGFKNAGIVVSHPSTLVTFGGLSKECVVAVFGMLIIIPLLQRKIPLAFICGMAGSTALAWHWDLVKVPENFFSSPDFSGTMFKLDIMGALQWCYAPAIVAILFTDMFDSISTFLGVAQAAGLHDENGRPKNLRQGLLVDALATLIAGLFGTSSGTAYIESAAGVEVGGRRGLTSVVTGLLFIPFLFLAPLAGMVPACATAPVLIVVGGLMFRAVTALKKVESENKPNGIPLEEALPAFLTIVLIPLTFSITQGILWGFIAHTPLFILAGRRKEVSPLMYVLSIISVGLIILPEVNWESLVEMLRSSF